MFNLSELQQSSPCIESCNDMQGLAIELYLSCVYIWRLVLRYSILAFREC